jgi:3-deoxy-D-manno-octulosonic-acid transferase
MSLLMRMDSDLIQTARSIAQARSLLLAPVAPLRQTPDNPAHSCTVWMRPLPFMYSLVTWLLLPASLLRLWWRGRKAPAYRQRWRERLGWYTEPARAQQRPCVVFHAVSVGEVHAAQPLIEAFMQQHPDTDVVVTTSTPTGSARVKALFDTRVAHAYLPWDLHGATTRFLRQFQPRLLVLLETELWPNLLRSCREQGCGVVLVNARLSEKSARGYGRFASLTRQMLQGLALVAAQAEADGQRFVALGLPPQKLLISGSLKFDVSIDAAKVAQAATLKQQWPRRPVWIAASTREGEDAKVLAAAQQVLQHIPQALLVLVPRHPERFAEAGMQAAALGLKVQYFSRNEPLQPETQVLLGDTMGDMVLYYSLADVAFVGGSLVNTGCQNIIEPAALGLPVLTGPSLFNFLRVSELLMATGGMQVVTDHQQLALAVCHLLQDEPERNKRGALAKAEVQRNQGSAERLVTQLAGLLTRAASR